MKVQIKAYGDRALLIEYPALIAPEINDQLLLLRHAIDEENLPGVSFLIPAFNSLTLGYDPLKTTFAKLKEAIEGVIPEPGQNSPEQTAVIDIPVCYEAPYALDLAEVSEQTGLSPAQIIDLHQATVYRVYMIGFLPGFPYLGILPQALEVSRKAVPRQKVDAGSVALAGRQTGIYPSAAPGGWQIIGRTPVSLFDPHRAAACFLKAGDRVRFRAISPSEFAAYGA